MRAVAVQELGGVDRLELLQLPVPSPGAGEVLVRVEAAGVNYVDAMFREGYLDPGARPLIMGSDFSGVVAALGERVDDLAVGDEVYGYKLLGNGTYAEFMTIRADWVAHKPMTLTHVEAASVPCVGLTAHQAMIDALDIQAGESVVVTGAAGGVGTIAVQLAADRGAHVIGTASEHNEEYVRGLGAGAFVDYTAGDWVEAVRALHPDGVDALLSGIGAETKRRSPDAIRDGGRFVWLSGEDKPGPPMERFVAGAYCGGMPRRDTLDALTALFDSGRLRVSLQEVYALEDAARAQTEVAGGHVRGKLVIAVGDAATAAPSAAPAQDSEAVTT
jgi:NADPH:quinone reductase-like Zn-dependent oxidoreductase